MSEASRSHANTIGQRMRARRLEKGLTQAGMAQACEWAGDNGKYRVSKYERDERDPGHDELVTLARALDCTVHYLLTGDDDTAVRVQMIPLSLIHPDADQPRRVDMRDNDHREAIVRLADSIREHGVLQPITVRPEPNQAPESDLQYRVIYGERRCRAAVEAHLSHIPAIVRTDIEDDGDRLAVQIIENLQRVDLSLAELITGIGKLAHTRTHEQIAAELGRSRSWVSRRASLYDCSAEVWAHIEAGHIADVDLAHAYEQLLDVEPDTAAMFLNHLHDGVRHSRESIQSHLRAARDRADEQHAEAEAARNTAAEQREREEQANDTTGGYDGPVDDSEPGPAEVTGREGTHNAERETTANQPTERNPGDMTRRMVDADEDSAELRRAFGRDVTVMPEMMRDTLAVRIGNLSAADWHSLKAHLQRWRPPAGEDLYPEEATAETNE